jgi:hypothetical protein
MDVRYYVSHPRPNWLGRLARTAECPHHSLLAGEASAGFASIPHPADSGEHEPNKQVTHRSPPVAVHSNYSAPLQRSFDIILHIVPYPPANEALYR